MSIESKRVIAAVLLGVSIGSCVPAVLFLIAGEFRYALMCAVLAVIAFAPALMLIADLSVTHSQSHSRPAIQPDQITIYPPSYASEGVPLLRGEVIQ